MGETTKTNKARLYIAVYARGPDLGDIFQPYKYHWALLIAPKVENPNTTGTRFVANPQPSLTAPQQIPWETEHCIVPLIRHHSIVARILIRKIKDQNGLLTFLLFSGLDPHRGDEVSYKTWIGETVMMLREDGRFCKYVPEWRVVERVVEDYARLKIDGGRLDDGEDMAIPTWDMICVDVCGLNGEAGVEVVP